MNDLENYDWKKVATQKLANNDLSQGQAELAFERAASSLMEDTATPLFKPPYYLGFELVTTNRTHTKMVGIFIFRVNREFLFAPVFYIDGNIKGHNIVYLADRKLFSQLSPEWSEYYLSELGDNQDQGSLVGVSDQNGANQAIDMARLALPPFMNKGASTKEDCKRSVAELFNFTMIGDAENETRDMELANKTFFNKEASSHPFTKFIKSVGIEGYKKIASIIRNDENLANYMVSMLEEDAIIPSSDTKVTEVSQMKTASENKPLIALHLGRFNEAGCKYAAEDAITKGYVIEDNRDKDSVDAIYSQLSEGYGSLNRVEMGVYDILGLNKGVQRFLTWEGNSDDNSTVRVFLSMDKEDPGILYNVTYSSGIECEGGRHRSGVLSKKEVSEILAQPVDETVLKGEVKDSAIKKFIDKHVKDEPAEGKVYSIYDPNIGYVSDEMWLIVSKEAEDDGIIAMEGVPAYNYDDLRVSDIHRNERVIGLTINKGLNLSYPDKKVFSTKTKWIEIPVELKNPSAELTTVPSSDKTTVTSDAGNTQLQAVFCKFEPGNVSSVYATGAATMPLRKATLVAGDFGSYVIEIDGEKRYSTSSKIASVVKLMHDFNITESDAEEVIAKAKESPNNKFAFFGKLAQTVLLNPDPYWFEGYDSDLGVNIQIPETKVIMTTAPSQGAPVPRYGDRYDPNAGLTSVEASMSGSNPKSDSNLMLRDADLESLAQFAQSSGKDSLFEHGMIATLANTPNAEGYIDEFIPDLRQGLDKLCRMYFLVLWSPSAFIDLYGNDDIIDIENKLVSTIKSYGDIVLELLKKTKNRTGLEISRFSSVE